MWHSLGLLSLTKHKNQMCQIKKNNNNNNNKDLPSALRGGGVALDIGGPMGGGMGFMVGGGPVGGGP